MPRGFGFLWTMHIEFDDLYLTFIMPRRFEFLKHDTCYLSPFLIFMPCDWRFPPSTVSYVKFCIARKTAFMIQKRLLLLILTVVLQIHL